MVVNKPSIYIYVNDPDEISLSEICAGIEEEGVLYTVVKSEKREASALAFSAADDSMLGSGIGMCESRVAMQIKGQKEGENVFSYDRPDRAECRALGANSARAIKKIPFKIL